MVSLPQAKKLNELAAQGYESVEHPDYVGLPLEERPIGGPAIMVSPEGDYIQVKPDGSVIPFENK